MCWEVPFSCWNVSVHRSILTFSCYFRTDHGEPDTSCREAKTTKSSAKSSIYELVDCLQISLTIWSKNRIWCFCRSCWELRGGRGCSGYRRNLGAYIVCSFNLLDDGTVKESISKLGYVVVLEVYKLSVVEEYTVVLASASISCWLQGRVMNLLGSLFI